MTTLRYLNRRQRAVFATLRRAESKRRKYDSIERNVSISLNSFLLPWLSSVQHPISLMFSSCLVICCLLSQDLMAGNWPTYHGDYNLTGVSADKFSGKPVRLWRTKIGKDAISSIVGGDGTLYSVADGSAITALDTKGEKLWSRSIQSEKKTAEGRLRDEVFSAPLLYVGKALLVAAAESGNVYGLSPKDGRQLWLQRIGAKIQASPTFAFRSKKDEPDQVFVLAQDRGVLHSLDAADGSKLWSSEALERADGHIAVADDHIVFGNCASSFVAIDISSGNRSSSIVLGEGCEMAGGIATSKGQVFAGNRSGSFAAADLDAEKVLWRHKESQGELFTTPAVTDERVVFSGGDAIIYCVDRVSGKEAWTYDTAGSAPLSPVIAGDMVIAAVDGTLFGLALDKGELRWKLTISDEISEPAIVDGVIVVGLDDGHVVAYGDAK